MTSWTKIAHRGGRSAFPENTIAAIDLSLKRGADLVEIDIRSSRDAVPVLIHDENLLRLFGLDKRVDEMDAHDLFALRHRNGSPPYSHRIFGFEETLTAVDAPKLLLHIKEPSDGLGTVLDIITRKTINPNDLVFGAVTLEAYSIIRTNCPASRILGFVPNPEHIPVFIEAGADVIRLWDEWVTPDLVESIRREGRSVWVMVGRPFDGEVGETTAERISELKHMGINGILLNDIDLLSA